MPPSIIDRSIGVQLGGFKGNLYRRQKRGRSISMPFIKEIKKPVIDIFDGAAMKLIIIMIISHLSWLPAFGGIENRPLNTDDAFTLKAGVFSLSAGSLYSWNRKQNDKVDIIVVDVGYGLTDNFEITVDIPFFSLSQNKSLKAQIFENFSIRPELRILSEGRYNPAFSIASTFEFQSSGMPNYYASIQITKSFDFLTCNINIGYASIGDKPGENNDSGLFYNFGFESVLTKKLVIVGELVGSTNSYSNFAGEPKEILLGLIFNVEDGLAFDLGIGKAISGSNPDPDIRITFGGTWYFY